MERITVSMDAALLTRLDAYMATSGATNRSEALRDLVRRGLSDGPDQRDGDCIAVISYALDPTQRDLGRRVPQSRHDRHDAAIAALSVPLDHTGAVEVSILRGNAGDLSDYAHGLFLERGIWHGQLSLIPITTVSEVHAHGAGDAHRHSHLRIKESF